MDELNGWTNFYLLIATASATLIGLLFVLITIAAQRRPGEGHKVQIYISPTVFYFASVLFLAALLTFPDHTEFTAALCICFVGVTGILYSSSRTFRHGRWRIYEGNPDRIAYAAFPLLAYALLTFGGVLSFYLVQRGLTLAAIGMLSLLAIAIRNSWDTTLSIVTTPIRRRDLE